MSPRLLGLCAYLGLCEQENRYRLLGEIVEAVKTVFPPSHISVRLSPNGVYGDMGSESNAEDFPYFASELAKVGAEKHCAFQ